MLQQYNVSVRLRFIISSLKQVTVGPLQFRTYPNTPLIDNIRMQGFHMENCLGEEVGVDFQTNFEGKFEKRKIPRLINDFLVGL